MYSSTVDNAFWNNPNEFNPDRFLKMPNTGGKVFNNHFTSGFFNFYVLMERSDPCEMKLHVTILLSLFEITKRPPVNFLRFTGSKKNSLLSISDDTRIRQYVGKIQNAPSKRFNKYWKRLLCGSL